MREPRPRWSSIRLQTARLLLRPPTPEDAPAAVELLTDPEVMRFLGGEIVPPEHAETVVRKWLHRWDVNDLGPFVIERREDGRFLGRAGINVWDTRTWTHTTLEKGGASSQAELGWALVRAQWGNGYATEAARAVRNWAREERGIGRLVSLIARDNTASQRVAQRLGARPTETVTLFDSADAVVWEYPTWTHGSHHGSTVTPPHSSGSTSRTVWVSSQR